MWAHPGKQLLFMGSEFGQESEWSEARSLDWWLLDLPDHRGVWQLIRDLNAVYKQHPALWTCDAEGAGFQWIDANDAEGNVLSFLRWGEDGSAVACIANFAGGPHEGYRVGLPFAGEWREIVNTDADIYAGSGVGNMGAVQAVDDPRHGQSASATLRVPPLGVLWLASPLAPSRQPEPRQPSGSLAVRPADRGMDHSTGHRPSRGPDARQRPHRGAGVRRRHDRAADAAQRGVHRDRSALPRERRRRCG